MSFTSLVLLLFGDAHIPNLHKLFLLSQVLPGLLRSADRYTFVTLLTYCGND
jgi:hypothetical protein